MRSLDIILRCFDFFLSLMAIFFLLPILLIIAVLIPLESRGTPLFIQTRVTKNGREFSCLKFRTMKINKEAFQGSIENIQAMDIEDLKAMRKRFQTTLKNDKRITKIGKILRRTSLDELPQLFNVFCGDMSLVGPRPDTPIQRADYRDVDWEIRTSVKAGITGLAQINGRSMLSLNERIRLDKQWIHNRGIIAYFKTIIATFSLLSRGAN